jgi:hypothetical protein
MRTRISLVVATTFVLLSGAFVFAWSGPKECQDDNACKDNLNGCVAVNDTIMGQYYISGGNGFVIKVCASTLTTKSCRRGPYSTQPCRTSAKRYSASDCDDDSFVGYVNLTVADCADANM